MKKVITAQDVLSTRKAGLTRLSVPQGAIVTPQARDDAKAHGIALAVQTVPLPSPSVSASPPPPSAATTRSSEMEAARALLSLLQTQSFPGPTGMAPAASTLQATACPTPAASGAPSPPPPTQIIPGQTTPPPQIDVCGKLHELVRNCVTARLRDHPPQEVIDAVITQVIAAMNPAVTNSPPALPDAATAAPAVRGGGQPSQNDCVVLVHRDAQAVPPVAAPPSGVRIIDTLPPDADGPGVGYMEFGTATFAWTFDAYEVLTVLEGQLTLTNGNRTQQAGPGDSFRIAPGTHVTLSSQGPVRCLYSAWPQ